MARRFFLSVTALFLFAVTAIAHEYRAGSIVIEHPWARATPKGAQVGGGYMTIVNHGQAPDRLIGGSLAAAERVMIHEMKVDGGVMTMRALERGLTIEPGASVTLAPGSLHVMFEGLQKPLAEGDRVKGTLIFEKAGPIEIEYAIQGMGEKAAPADAGPHSHH